MSISKNLKDLFLEILKTFGFKIVHFIHIGKTAGTAIKDSIETNKFIWGNLYRSRNYIFQMESHSFTLKNLKKNEFVFFIIRDPLSRFISGFYSRFRMGQPRLYNPWSDAEKIAFSKFTTVNQLGEALDSDDLELKESAQFALKSIGHVGSSYWNWFIDKEYLVSRKDSILFYLRQENLNEDIEYVGEKLGFKFPALSSDEIKSHKNPEYFDKFLSERAKNNLSKWYKKEYEFITIIQDIFKNEITH